ncbi:DUF4129 domain-containing protein [Agromyces sp. MMS24-JH15]|uniref:DUF4129 domain-containing protein n=1 Tax=Agromyces sp. MMS24-JH15 TaxID=3243765 RepID=UPI003748664A
MRWEVPVDPDAEEARRWLQEELAKPEYQAAQPTWFDRLMQSIREWLEGVLSGAGGIPTPWVVLVVVLVIAGLVVLGLLVFGVPRLRRRRAAVVPLFDDGDLRDLRTLRRAAESAAAAGDWPLAIEERFRALVRGTVERELLRVDPGTTAHGFADAATRPFPGAADRLGSAADDFDAVRYLGAPGSREAYDGLTRLEADLAAATPAGAADAADDRFPAVPR